MKISFKFQSGIEHGISVQKLQTLVIILIISDISTQKVAEQL